MELKKRFSLKSYLNEIGTEELSRKYSKLDFDIYNALDGFGFYIEPDIDQFINTKKAIEELKRKYQLDNWQLLSNIECNKSEIIVIYPFRCRYKKYLKDRLCMLDFFPHKDWFAIKDKMFWRATLFENKK